MAVGAGHFQFAGMEGMTEGERLSILGREIGTPCGIQRAEAGRHAADADPGDSFTTASFRLFGDAFDESSIVIVRIEAASPGHAYISHDLPRAPPLPVES